MTAFTRGWLTPAADAALLGTGLVLVLAVLAARPLARRLHAREHDDLRRVRAAAHAGALVLTLVALIGAVLSFDNLRKAAAVYIGPDLAWTFPALVDALILGCTLRYVTGLRQGRFVPGYRLLAYGGIVWTVYLNALASQDAGGIPWHIAPPLAWAAILELAARDAIGEYQATHRIERSRIPSRLWATQPLSTLRVALHMTRNGGRDYVTALREVGVIEAACEALRLALPGWQWQAVRVRWVIRRYLRRGTVSCDRLLEAARFTGEHESDEPLSPTAMLRAVLEDVLAARAPVRARPTRKRAHDERGDERAPDPPALILTDEQMSEPEQVRARIAYDLLRANGQEATAPTVITLAGSTKSPATMRRWLADFRAAGDPSVEEELADLLHEEEPANT